MNVNNTIGTNVLGGRKDQCSNPTSAIGHFLLLGVIDLQACCEDNSKWWSHVHLDTFGGIVEYRGDKVI